jgi:uncharacterized protein YlxW (UPF0749 family)
MWVDVLCIHRIERINGEDMFAKPKKWFLDEVLNLAMWLITFGLIYWLATDNLWLCLFITIALVASFSNKASKDVLEVLHPIHRDIDRYINELKEKNEQLEQDVEELKNTVRKLKVKIDEFDN